jgi:hypothetical protein
MPVIKKSAFARQIGVDPSRITQYLRDGLLDGAAIVGEGRGAMIDSDVACAQLRERLNPDQSYGTNGLWTKLGGQPDDMDVVKGAMAVEKLNQAKWLTRKQAQEEQARNGMLVDAAEAQAKTDRDVGAVKSWFQNLLHDLAGAIAAAGSNKGAPLSRKEAKIVLDAGWQAAFTRQFGSAMYPAYLGLADSKWDAMTQEEREAAWKAGCEREAARLAAEEAEAAAFEESYPAMKARRLKREAEGF